MTLRHLFLIAVIGSSLFTSCMSSKEWVDDDVYVLKSVDIPTDTDISDETDYNAFVYNRRNSSAQTSYYSQFYYSPMIYNRWMYPNYYNNVGWVGNHGGYYGMAFYDPNYYSMFGYSYYYDPFWGYSTPYYYGGYGYPYYGYGYGYGYSPGYGYGGNNGGGSLASHPHFTGPRGSISGYGGVRSQSTQAYKSAPAGGAIASNGPARRATEPTKTVNKPVTSYDRAGRSSGAPTRTASSLQPTVARGTTTGTIQRHAETGTVTRNSVPRPETTTTRTVNRGTYTGTPSRAGNSDGYNNTGSGRSQGTYNSGGSAPRQSSGSSGSSGSSRSGSSGGGGTKTVGRR